MKVEELIYIYIYMEQDIYNIQVTYKGHANIYINIYIYIYMTDRWAEQKRQWVSNGLQNGLR
jgi:hypothetical protein